MSGITSSEEEKYVNGCRLSSSLLELQPFKVIENNAKPTACKDTSLRRQSHNNNNNRYKDRRTHSSPGFDDEKPPKQPWDNSEMPLLATKAEDENTHGTSVSCDNIFNSPSLQVKLIPNNNGTPGQSPIRSVEYDPVTHGSSLPKPITRTASKEQLLSQESPNHVPSEQKKTKPKKPNRESLRRSRPDIRASQPNLQATNRSSVTPSGSPEHNPTPTKVQSIPAGHEYEELPTDIKILQQRKISSPPVTESPIHKSPSQDIGFTPISFQSQTSPAVPERAKNPRQRLNPLYAGIHMNPYEQRVANNATTQKRPATRCLCCLVTGVTIAVIFSILSVAVVSLLFLGYLEPMKGFANQDSYQGDKDLISRLQNEILALKNATNQTSERIDVRLEDTKFDLIQAVKDLNISALKGPSTIDFAKCEQTTFAIGSSSSQDKITTGEYFAEKGFVTTGVTCSASTGYIAYLRTREEEDDDYSDENLPQPRVIYECTCHKLPGSVLPSPRDRVECTIHYWQCPIL